MYQKEFDKWNVQKKRLDQFNHGRNFYFYEREVWWCALGVNVGIETDGKHEYFERPVLILKRFNSSMLWVLPLTSDARDDGFHFRVHLEGKTSWVKLTQIKTIDVKHLLRKIATLDGKEFESIQNVFCGYIKTKPATRAGISEAEADNKITIVDEESSVNKDLSPEFIRR